MNTVSHYRLTCHAIHQERRVVLEVATVQVGVRRGVWCASLLRGVLPGNIKQGQLVTSIYTQSESRECLSAGRAQDSRWGSARGFTETEINAAK